MAAGLAGGRGWTSRGRGGRSGAGCLKTREFVILLSLFCHFPICCHFLSFVCHFPIFWHVLSFLDFFKKSFLAFPETSVILCVMFFVVFCLFLSCPETSVIFCHWGNHFLSFPETSGMFLSLGQSCFFQVRNLCHLFCHFCVISRTSVMLSVIFLVSPLPGPWLCQYVRIPGQTIQRPCLLLEGSRNHDNVNQGTVVMSPQTEMTSAMTKNDSPNL